MATEYPWAHEKQLRLREEKEDYLDSPSKPLPAKKKRNYCKKLKGNHVFEPFERPKSYWFSGKKLWNEFRCTGCGKQKLEFFNNL